MPLTIDIRKTAFYQKGKAEGKAENMKEIALQMLKIGKYDIEEISSITGLPYGEVIELREQL